MCDNNPEKTEKTTDNEGSDEVTQEDLEVPMTNLTSNESLWEERPVVSKDNATRYCAERLLETKVGKLCANLGTNVQALVNVCSADIEVSFYQCFYLIRNGFERLFFKVSHIQSRMTHTAPINCNEYFMNKLTKRHRLMKRQFFVNTFTVIIWPSLTHLKNLTFVLTLWVVFFFSFCSTLVTFPLR